jgi:FKBP-type peptidyl-prolyl cis-trans isomerase
MIELKHRDRIFQKLIITNMKKLLIIPLILLALTLNAQKRSQKTAAEQPKTPPTEAPQAKPADTLKLASNADSTQYILGAYLGQYLLSNNLTVTNPTLFIKGMDDVITGKQLMVPADSIPKRMGEYLSKMAVERSILLEKQLFEAVKGQPGVGTLPTGVCYVIAKAGSGIRPLAGDSITFHIKGYLPEGTMFEDSYAKNTPLKATPANLIPGLKDAILIMPEGSAWRIYIPSAQAYGEKGISGVIPQQSALVFDLELLSVKQEKNKK